VAGEARFFAPPVRQIAARPPAWYLKAMPTPPSLAAVAVALLALAAAVTPSRAAAADKPQPIPLWPAEVPGEKGDIGPEADQSQPGKGLVAGKPLIRLGNVSKPTITIYKPPADKDTGAAVVVCPGGGYGILAYDLEGSEVCDWLNSVGVTGVLLKYRVPSRKGLPKEAAALQDVQRAIGVVRHRAAEWKIDPKKIGVLGFSAGGHLSASAATRFAERMYPAVDDADKESCRPDAAFLIYPAYLTDKADVLKLAPDLKVTDQTPPTFIVQTQDDGIKVENAYVFALACKAAKVPCEVHTYAKGGHGYGLREVAALPVTKWPVLATEWMRGMGWVK
jgi:acetyl esterase/lipase